MKIPVSAGPHFSKDSKSLGAKRTRHCYNCNKEITDDGSVAFLRGFCSENCYEKYLAQQQ